MKVYLKEGFDYIPDWNGNKKKKKEDQIVVHFDFLSAESVMDCFDSNGQMDKTKDWLCICKSVKNLVVNDKKIDAIGILKTKGLATLYYELRTAFKLESEFDKKK